MRALVSGMGGFVGTYLAKALRLRDIEVSGFGIHPAPALQESGCNYHLCDITDYSAVRELVQSVRPHHVYHLAAFSQPSLSLTKPRECYRVNCLGTAHLLESLREAQLNPRILVVSSAHVYEPRNDRMRIREDGPIKPRLPYGVSKWVSEQIARQYGRDYGLSILIARPFNHSGPGQEVGYVIPDFARQVARLERLSGGDIEVRNLRPVRDFLHVRDVVEAYIQLLERGVDGETYNVASGEGLSIQEILNQLLALTEIDYSIRSSLSSSEPDHLVGDSGKLMRTTGWYPQKSISGMLREVLQEWRERLEA